MAATAMCDVEDQVEVEVSRLTSLGPSKGARAVSDLPAETCPATRTRYLHFQDA